MAAEPLLPTADLGPCPYLDGRQFSAELVPEFALQADNEQQVGMLLSQGFRRNGGYWYRPRCADCQACVSLRVDVQAFQPRRDQRRCAKRNADLITSWQPRGIDDERNALYRRYQRSIHHDQAADDANDLHLGGQCPGGELHARDGDGNLLAVSILDRCDHGLSSVYCYYDPDHPRRALGTFMVLAEIAAAQRQNLPWLYLGYTIDANQKMVYKQRFGPHQRRDPGGGEWGVRSTI